MCCLHFCSFSQLVEVFERPIERSKLEGETKKQLVGEIVPRQTEMIPMSADNTEQRGFKNGHKLKSSVFRKMVGNYRREILNVIGRIGKMRRLRIRYDSDNRQSFRPRRKVRSVEVEHVKKDVRKDKTDADDVSRPQPTRT